MQLETSQDGIKKRFISLTKPAWKRFKKIKFTAFI